jgi:hypothetical protein
VLAELETVTGAGKGLVVVVTVSVVDVCAMAAPDITPSAAALASRNLVICHAFPKFNAEGFGLGTGDNDQAGMLFREQPLILPMGAWRNLLGTWQGCLANAHAGTTRTATRSVCVRATWRRNVRLEGSVGMRSAIARRLHFNAIE